MAVLQTSLLVLLATCLVNGGIIQGPPSYAVPQADKTYFEFDDIHNPDFRPRGFNGRWYGDVIIYTDKDGNLKSRDMAGNMTETILVPAAHMASVSRYFVSPDLQHVLFAKGWKQVWRHSFTAEYHAYSVADSTSTPVPPTGERLQFCDWGPANGKLAYTHGFNFHILNSTTHAGDKMTDDGMENMYYNGIPDWLYEEDVLSTNKGHYWGPDGRYVVMAKFNDNGVGQQAWKVYGDVSDVYGKITHLAYPKAGDVKDGDVAGQNTRVTLHVIDTDTGSGPFATITPPEELKDIDHYFTRVGWITPTLVVITWTNRVQNESVVQACHVMDQSLSCHDHYKLHISGGWIDSPWPNPVPVSDTSYLTILPKEEGDSGMWKHLALMEIQNDTLAVPKFLTSGKEEILAITGYDKETDSVYYLSTGGHPLKRHLYKYEMQNGTTTCVSCDVGSTCQYVSASMSSSGDWYTLSCLGPDIPSYHIRSTRDDTSMVMEDNSAIRSKLEGKYLATREFMDVPVGGGYTSQAEIFKPPNFDANKKYPLLVFVYAGPGSQKVYNRYYIGGSQNNWMMHLKSKHNVVVASIDGRGAMARGEKFKFEMYRRLGTVEVEDQLSLATYLKKNLGYIDTTKDAAVFGWSYGGQTSSHILADSTGEYNCAIAVAPVSSKKYYDTAYTERYMGLATKADNEAGYNATELFPKAAKFSGKKYLIAHGTSDDNVHFMHAAHFINELVKEEIQFHQLMYVDQNHNIATRPHSRHLFRAMTDFLVNDCWELNKPDPPTLPPQTTPVSAAPTQHLTWRMAFISATMLVISYLRL